MVCAERRNDDEEDDTCSESDTQEETSGSVLLVCDNCDLCFHYDCLRESDQCPRDEIGREDCEWYCPACSEEYADDITWARESTVDDADMTADDCFTRSLCTCQVCASMNAAVDTWHVFEPENDLQRGLKRAIDERQGLVRELMNDIHARNNVAPLDAE